MREIEALCESGQRAIKVTTQRIWAVVPTYNQPAAVMRCLESLEAQTVRLAGTVLVANGCPVDVGVQVQRCFAGRVTVLWLNENLGPAAGFAAGIRASLERGADWVWLMDDDARPLPNALEMLTRANGFAQGDVVALSSLKQDPDGTPQKWEAVIKHGLFRPPNEEAYGRQESPLDAAAFAGLLVRATAVERAGLPDSRYFSWFSDYEFCLRLRPHGRILYVPGSRVVHKDDSSTGLGTAPSWFGPDPTPFLKLCTGLRNQVYYFSRHPGWVATLLQVLFRFVRIVGRVLCLDDRKLFYLRMLSCALFDGLRGRLGPFGLLKQPQEETLES